MVQKIAIDGIGRLLCRIHSLPTGHFPDGLLPAGLLPYIAGLLLLQAHTLQAKDIATDSLTVKIYYLRGSSDISGVPGNARSLEHFLHQVDSVFGLSHVAPIGVTVVSSTSPEGGIRLNHALSHARAQSVLDFLSRKSEPHRLVCPLHGGRTDHGRQAETDPHFALSHITFLGGSAAHTDAGSRPPPVQPQEGGNCTPTQRGLIYFAYPELYCHKITNFAKNTRPCGDGIKQTTLPRPRPWAIVS